jgi:rhodanese-related sulfurtransferase
MRWRQFFTPVKSLNSEETRELLQEAKEDIQILDVRQPSEYQRSHIPGAQLIPLAQLGSSLDQLDRDKPIVVY